MLWTVKQRNKIVSVHGIKAYSGCAGMATLNLHGHYMKESGQLHASAALLHRKECRQGEAMAPEPVWTFGRREMSLYSCRDVNPGSTTPWYHYTNFTS